MTLILRIIDLIKIIIRLTTGYQLLSPNEICMSVKYSKSRPCVLSQSSVLCHIIVENMAFTFTALEQSNLCCEIYRIKTSPVGYADDVAACTTSKRRMDLVMEQVHQHGCDWRYSFNAGKSAVLVFGESNKDRKHGSENRMFMLGGKRVKERLYYEHVGIKTCVKGDTCVRTEERVTKARKALNASTNVGIRRGGLNLSTCNLIYWTFVIPTLLFGCEIWVLKDKDLDILNGFQRYAARRLQRLHSHSLNVTSLACLGWMNLILFIKARKIIFVRTILQMEECMPVRRILVERFREYRDGCTNPYDSPVIQILNYCKEFDLMRLVDQMIRGHIFSKTSWKKIVWEKAWEIEDREWREVTVNHVKMDLIRMVTDKPTYSIWWLIADKWQIYMKRCELMIKLICHASRLKADDSRLLRASFIRRSCSLCDHACYENVLHMVMQCAYHNDLRNEMYAAINVNGRALGNVCTFEILMGGVIEGWDSEGMLPIWKISCTYISKMYYNVINSRLA